MLDDRPGITRRRKRNGAFDYFGVDGKRITDTGVLQRIRSLAIPPAYSDVWICPAENGHLQATGRDARGRKQYRYHPRWRASRDETKYGRMVAFGHALPQIRKRVSDDLAKPGLTRDKVLATVVRLLEESLIRVGNEEYARTNQSYGLTTMQRDHVEFEGSCVLFRFRGKHGIMHNISVCDRRLTRIIRQCRDLPGQVLFQYLDEKGAAQDIGSAEVNDYLRAASGSDFTAKDFRTWAGTVLAAVRLLECGHCTSQREAKRQVTKAVETVSQRLGNTVAVCRKCYIHPAVIDCYMKGSLADELQSRRTAPGPDGFPALRPEETAVLAMLERQSEPAARRAAA